MIKESTLETAIDSMNASLAVIQQLRKESAHTNSENDSDFRSYIKICKIEKSLKHNLSIIKTLTEVK